MTRVAIPQLHRDDGSESSRNERARQIDLFKAEVGQKLISVYAPIAGSASAATYAGYNLSLESEGFKESSGIDFAIATAGSAAVLGIVTLKSFVDTQCEYAKNYKAPSVIAASTSAAGLQINQLHQALDNLKSKTEEDDVTIKAFGAEILQLKGNNRQLELQVSTLEKKLSEHQNSSINSQRKKT